MITLSLVIIRQQSGSMDSSIKSHLGVDLTSIDLRR